jgi:nucleoside-diphosphate-sugar epimerase
VTPHSDNDTPHRRTDDAARRPGGRPPRYLVTGATGGLGRNAVEFLLERGATVRASGRDPEAGRQLAAAGAEFAPHDLAVATPELAALTRGVDVVWHCAALTATWGPRSAFLVANVDATGRLLRAAAEAGATRFVYISSPSIYFEYRHRYHIGEHTLPAACVNAYAESKVRAEALVAHAAAQWPQMRCVILRPRAIFGRHDRVLLPRLLRMHARLRGRLLLPGGGRTLLDLTYAENVVHAMQLASRADFVPPDVLGVPTAPAYNITNHQPVRLREALLELFARMARPCRIVNVPYPLLAAGAHLQECAATLFGGGEPALTTYGVAALAYDMTLDTTRARRELGYVPPVPLADGIARTAAWLAQHG